MLIEAKLKNPIEPLQIPYPEGFAGQKSGNSEDKEIFVSTQPKKLSSDEISVIKKYLQKQSYSQQLILTGCVMGVLPDIEGFVSNAEMTLYEQKNALESTAISPNGGRRLLEERKLIVTERVVARMF